MWSSYGESSVIIPPPYTSRMRKGCGSWNRYGNNWRLESMDKKVLDKSVRNRDLLSQKGLITLSLAAIFYVILLSTIAWSAQTMISSSAARGSLNIMLHWSVSYQTRSLQRMLISASPTGTNLRNKCMAMPKRSAWNNHQKIRWRWNMKTTRTRKCSWRHSRETDNWRGEVVHHTKTGEPLNVDVAVSAIRDTDGNMVGTVSVIRNVTERRKTQKKTAATDHAPSKRRSRPKCVNWTRYLKGSLMHS